MLHILAFECREVLASVRDLQENPEFFFFAVNAVGTMALKTMSRRVMYGVQ